VWVGNTGTLQAFGNQSPWTGGDYIGMYHNNASHAHIEVGGSTYRKLMFDTGGSTRMTIDTAGNVGIGTSSPTSPLHTYGNANASIINRVENANSGANAYAAISLKGDAREYQLVEGASGSAFPNKFVIYDHTAASARVTVDTSGNVGIGTTSPQAALDVSGDISTGGGGIKWKLFSGTTATGTTPFAHGLTASKIVNFVCSVRHTNGNYYQLPFFNSIRVYWDATNATIEHTGDAGFNSQAYRCQATYVP
jgi:hypothetical protein